MPNGTTTAVQSTCHTSVGPGEEQRCLYHAAHPWVRSIIRPPSAGAAVRPRVYTSTSATVRLCRSVQLCSPGLLDALLVLDAYCTWSTINTPVPGLHVMTSPTPFWLSTGKYLAVHLMYTSSIHAQLFRCSYRPTCRGVFLRRTARSKLGKIPRAR